MKNKVRVCVFVVLAIILCMGTWYELKISGFTFTDQDELMLAEETLDDEVNLETVEEEVYVEQTETNEYEEVVETDEIDDEAIDDIELKEEEPLDIELEDEMDEYTEEIDEYTEEIDEDDDNIDSYSMFPIPWDDTEESIEVHVYNMNAEGIDEVLDTEYTQTGSTIYINDVVDHIHANTEFVGNYNFEYAIVDYEIDNDRGGYDTYDIGNIENSVISIEKTENIYTVILEDSSVEIVDDPYDIEIYLYFSTPTVNISVIGEEHNTDIINFALNYEYFKGLDENNTLINPEYSWSLDDDNMGTLTNVNGNEVTFTWSENAQEGDQITIKGTLINTYIFENNEEIIENASDSYTLTYGDKKIDIYVYQSDGRTVQSDAHVALIDENGNTVATGITDEDGKISMYVVDGTYTIGSTYVYEDTSNRGPSATVRMTGESELIVPADRMIGSVTLTTSVSSQGINGSYDVDTASGWNASTPYYYEHLDVKYNGSYILDSVYIYDKYGNLIYVSADLVKNGDTNDYNCKFNLNGTEDIHSIVLSSEDTIVFTYEVEITNSEGFTITKTHTLTVTASLYMIEKYYSYEYVNSYQIYNILYGTSYSEDEFLELVNSKELPGYNELGIDISALNYFQLADYLCDTRTDVSPDGNIQAGLDFSLDIVSDLLNVNLASMEIKKVSQTNERLNGVTFEVKEFYLDGEEYTTQRYDGEDGIIRLELNLDTHYVITEIATLDGFYLYDTPIYIYVDSNGDIHLSEDSHFTNEVLNYDDGAVEIAYNEDEDCYDLTVVNESHIIIAETGGIGTRIFVVVGIIIMIGAGVTLVIRNKK